MSKKNTNQLRKLYVRHQRLRTRNAQMNTVNRIAFCLLVLHSALFYRSLLFPAYQKLMNVKRSIKPSGRKNSASPPKQKTAPNANTAPSSKTHVI